MANELEQVYDLDVLEYQHLAYTLTIMTTYTTYHSHRPIIIPNHLYGADLSSEYAYWCTQEIFKINRELKGTDSSIHCIYLNLIDIEADIKVATAIIEMNKLDKYMILKNKCLDVYYNIFRPYFDNMIYMSDNELRPKMIIPYIIPVYITPHPINHPTQFNSPFTLKKSTPKAKSNLFGAHAQIYSELHLMLFHLLNLQTYRI